MSDIQTFCDSNGDIVGFALAAHTATVDPVTCTPVFGLQANYYDTDWVSLGSSLPAGWELCCCDGGGETVTTLIKNGAANTATYTNEVGATTVLTETDFTENSQIIPATCEGILPDAQVLRELPTRFDTGTQTYRVFDDGSSTSLAVRNAVCGIAPAIGTYTPIHSLTINNPSTCKPMTVVMEYMFPCDVYTAPNTLMFSDVELSINGGPFALDYSAYHPGLNASGIRGYGSPHHRDMQPFIVPPGGSLTIGVRGVVRYDTGAAGSIWFNYCLTLSMFGVTQ